jgi:hypothetical protein
MTHRSQIPVLTGISPSRQSGNNGLDGNKTGSLESNGSVEGAGGEEKT